VKYLSIFFPADNFQNSLLKYLTGNDIFGRFDSLQGFEKPLVFSKINKKLTRHMQLLLHLLCVFFHGAAQINYIMNSEMNNSR